MNYIKPCNHKELESCDQSVKKAFSDFLLSQGFLQSEIITAKGSEELSSKYYWDLILQGDIFSLEMKKTGWVDALSFPYPTVDIPFRKSTKHSRKDKEKNDGFRYFVLFHRDLKSFIVVRRNDFDDSPWEFKPNKYVTSGEEEYVKIPVDKAYFIALINDKWNIKKGHETWQTL